VESMTARDWLEAEARSLAATLAAVGIDMGVPRDLSACDVPTLAAVLYVLRASYDEARSSGLIP